MKQINFRVIIFGLLISLGVRQFIILIQTTLGFLDIRDVTDPIVSYLLMWRFYLVITGIYIGFSRVKNKIIYGGIVGILHDLTSWLFYMIVIQMLALRHPDLSSHEFKFNLLVFGYKLLECGFICAIVSWGTYKIILRRKRGQTSTV